MLAHQGAESFIQQACVVQIRPQAPRVFPELLVDRHADPYAWHAMTMPHPNEASARSAALLDNIKMTAPRSASPIAAGLDPPS